jgi:hypothetical protein
MLTVLTQIPPFVSGSQQWTLNGKASGFQHSGAKLMIEIMLRDATSAHGLGL